MALKILGWGTMVGTAFLGIMTMKIWMKPFQNRAAQMVRFVEPLACPSERSPTGCQSRGCPRVPTPTPLCRFVQNVDYARRDAADKHLMVSSES